MGPEFFQMLLLRAPGILFGLTVHEFAHAWAARKYGDTTAAEQGRLSLNPFRHLDLLGTIMLIFGPFGWAKPVPVDPRALKNPIKDMMFISLAGPLVNIITGIVLALVFRFSIPLFLSSPPGGVVEIIFNMLFIAVIINFGLGLFNLLPIPPLDGGGILRGLLPYKLLVRWMRWEPSGMFVLMGIIFLDYFAHIGILSFIFGVPLNFLATLFGGPYFPKFI